METSVSLSGWFKMIDTTHAQKYSMMVSSSGENRIFLARIIAGLVGSGTGEGSYAETVVRYAIIALFSAIGLTFMGLADQIVMLAFGLILGSAAIACAIAFGLGGRDAAAQALDRWADQGAPPSPPPSPRRIRSGGQSGPDDAQPPLV